MQNLFTEAMINKFESQLLLHRPALKLTTKAVRLKSKYEQNISWKHTKSKLWWQESVHSRWQLLLQQPCLAWKQPCLAWSVWAADLVHNANAEWWWWYGVVVVVVMLILTNTGSLFSTHHTLLHESTFTYVTSCFILVILAVLKGTLGDTKTLSA